ncbi:MAG: hypothetical protein F7B59_01725 [Desulfurococcales archaeon]|nr:hypothetical protein [Desulfurococcales archaeon]
MVDVSCSVLGGYPRNRRVRHLVRDYEEGRLSSNEFYNALMGESIFLAGVQRALGCECIVDGMLEWHDILRPFVNSWRGVYLSGLLRYFDNNFFYRIPVFREAPEPMNHTLSTKFNMIKDYIGSSLYKAVIPGPATFAALSKNETGKDDVWLAVKIAEALNSELRGLSGNDIIIQIDEPALTDKELYDRIRSHLEEIYGSLLPGLDTSVRVSVYFGCVLEDAYAELLDVKGLDFVTLDGVDCKKISTLIKEYGVKNRKLGLGVIEARDIYEDDYTKVKTSVSKVLEEYEGDLSLLHLTTSTWLDLIPYEYAVRKTGVLSYYSNRIKEEVD